MLGGIVIYDGFCKLSSADLPTAQPRAVSLSNLIDEAPARRVYVTVGDFQFGGQFVEVTSDKGPLGDAYLPALDGDGRFAVFKTLSFGSLSRIIHESGNETASGCI